MYVLFYIHLLNYMVKQHFSEFQCDIVKFYKKRDLSRTKHIFFCSFFFLHRSISNQEHNSVKRISYPSEDAVVDLASDKGTWTEWTTE
jgi:hypothetical protein